MQCKVRILKPLEGVYREYQPEVGKVYDADYFSYHTNDKKYGVEFVVVDIRDKKIIVRRGEFERVGDNDGK